MTDWVDFVKQTGAVASLGVLVGVILNILAERRKKKAEVGHIDANVQLTLVGAANDVVEMMKRELERLEESNRGLRDRLAELERQMVALRDMNRQLTERCDQLEAENMRLREG